MVRVSKRFPVFEMSKVFVTGAPTVTVPKSTSVGLMASLEAPETPVPARGTVTLPVEDVTTNDELTVPVVVGAKTMGTEMEALGASVVPTVGGADVPKGAVGSVTPEIVVLVAPLLVMLTLSVTFPPVGTSPKARLGGAESSPS